MKKFAAILTAAVMAVSSLSIPVYAAQSDAESILVEVKGIIDISEDMTEFNYSEREENGKKSYIFNWENEDYTKSCNMSVNSEGKITSYYYYDDTRLDGKKKIINKNVDDARKAAVEFLAKTYPEYMNAHAEDGLIESNVSLRVVNGAKRFSFMYDLTHNGVKVEGNNVNISVSVTNDDALVVNMYANIDFEAKFSDEEKGSAGKEEYKKQFPIDMLYQTFYNESGEEVKLIYTVEKGYISTKDGSVIERYGENNIYNMSAEKTADDDAGGMGGSRRLMPKEIEELTNMDSLISKAELEKKLREMPELKVTDKMVLEYSDTFKTENGYETRISLGTKDDDEDYRYLSATFDAQSGEILYIYNGAKEDNYDKLTDEEKAKARKAAQEFAEKCAGDKIKETKADEDRDGFCATRLVNNIPYPENNVVAKYSIKDSMIKYYRVIWDEDTSKFPDAEKAIGKDEAYEKALDIAKPEYVYVNTKDGYVLALTIAKNVSLDAVTGEDTDRLEEERPVYEDISGHWAEKEIKALLDQDIYLAGNSFRPDEAINQADMLSLFTSAIYDGSYITARGFDYDWFIRVTHVIDKEDIDPDKLMTREEAFEAFAAMLGFEEITKLDIYKPSFEDAAAFTNGIGSAEILKGMKIIIGDSARPTDKLTRAEAAVMVYRYLDR